MHKKTYCGTYDILKFAASLMIVFAHMIQIFGLFDHYPVTDALAVYVELFFIISGFFLMSHVDALASDTEETTAGYLLHKCGGFFGALCIVNAVHFFFFCYFNDIHTASGVLWKLWHFKWEFLMLQCGNFIQNPQFNTDYLVGPAWYLSAMMITQAVLYPLARYYRKDFVRIICPLMIVFVYCFAMQKYGTINMGKDITYLLPDSLHRAFAGQCCGVIAYEASGRARRAHFYEKKEGAILYTVCWLVFPLSLVLTFGKVEDGNIFFILPFMVITAGAGLGVTSVDRFLQRIPSGTCRVLGRCSLYIYLTHFPVILAVAQLLGAQSTSLKVVVSIAGTALYAVILYMIDRKRKSACPVVVISVLALIVTFLNCLR